MLPVDIHKAGAGGVSGPPLEPGPVSESCLLSAGPGPSLCAAVHGLSESSALSTCIDPPFSPGCSGFQLSRDVRAHYIPIS